MKKMIALVLALMLVLTLAACGAEEAAPAATTAAPAATEAAETTAATEATEAAFQFPTVEVPETLMVDGVVGSYFGEIVDYDYINVTMELVDDNTIKFDLYQPYLFCAADIKALEVGNTLVMGDRQVLVEEIQIVPVDDMDEEGYNININPNGEAIDMLRRSVFDGENFVWGDYQPLDVVNNFTLMYGHTFTVEAAADKLLFVKMTNSGAEEMTGADLVQALKDNAEAFNMNNTAVTFFKGALETVTLLDFV